MIKPFVSQFVDNKWLKPNYANTVLHVTKTDGLYVGDTVQIGNNYFVVTHTSATILKIHPSTQTKIKPHKAQEPFLTLKGANALSDLNSFCNSRIKFN